MESYLIDKIKLTLRKSFDLREGEYAKAILMFVYIFLIITSVLILKPTVTSLFLTNFGVEELPIAFLLVAIFAAVFATIYIHYLKIYTLNKIIKSTLILSNITFLILWIAMQFGIFLDSSIYFFYVWVAIFALLSTSQFWIFANLLFNYREAKRLFGFIGSGAIAGGIFGGYLVSVLANWVGSINLVLISIFLLSFCIPIVNYLWNKFVPSETNHIQHKKQIWHFSNHPVSLIRQSRHLTYLAVIVGLSVIVAKFIDFQFSAIAYREFVNEDELTVFFGFWFSTMNIVSLLVQIFVTRRAVGVFGVGTSLFFLPSGIFLGTVALLINPAVWSAVFLKLSDGSLKQSINKSSMELLALPIPVEIKNQTKSFIDIFVDSAATGLGGIILIIMTSGFDLPIEYISIATIFLILIWFYVASKVREEYLRAFKLKVEQNLDQPKKFDFENESVLSGIISVLKSGTEDQILEILRMTKQIQNDYLIEAIAGHLTSSSTSIRLETLRNLYFYKSQNYSNKVTLMLEDDSEAIRIEACQYLFEHNPLNSIELLSGYLYHSNIKVRNAALVSLAIETVGNQDLKEILNISLVVKQRIIELAKIDPAEDQVLQNCAIVKTIGHAHLSEHYNYLISMTNDESNEVANEAIISMGRTTEPSFVNLIIAKLSSKKAASASITALTNYGILVHEELIKLLLDSDNELGIRKNLIRVIGEIGNQKSVQVLLNILDDEDYRLRTDSLITLNSLKIKFPYLEFDWRRIEKNLYEEVKIEAETIQVLFVQNNIELSEIRSQNIPNKNPLIESRRRLIQLLNQRQNSGLERIFRLLGLKYPPDDLINIFHGIQRNELDIQINAIEFLDNLLDESSLKKIILLIIESTIMNSISDEFIRKIGKKIPSEYECYEILLNRNDIELAITTLNVISKSRSEKFKNLLIQTEGHKNKKVRKFAKKIHSNFESVD
ncbi:MAG: hypothetical protein ABIG69_19525 [Bacteroidota bacterium]